MHVGKDLDFDMARAIDKLFEINTSVAERGLGFLSSLVEGVLEVGLALSDPHAFPASTGGCFDQYGVAYFGGRFDRVVYVVN